MTVPKITIPDRDTTLLIPCTRCDHPTLLPAQVLLRGTNYICDGCGAHIEFSRTQTKPVIAIRVSTPDEATTLQAIMRRDGVWILLDAGERSILDVLDYDSDRAVAIITGSMIENRLQRAICNRSQRNRTIENRLFNPSGPLGTFSAKIDIAYMNGLISDAAHADLVIFKDIRNLFAHDLRIRDFNSQRIIDKANNLHLVDRHIEEHLSDSKSDMVINIVNWDEVPTLRLRHASRRKKVAKDRYLMTAQVLTVRLALLDRKDRPLPFV